MDNIDYEIHKLYDENNSYKKVSKSKFMILLISVITLNVILFLYSIRSNSLFIRLVFNIISGISMTAFFTWFLYNLYEANKR